MYYSLFSNVSYKMKANAWKMVTAPNLTDESKKDNKVYVHKKNISCKHL